MRIRNMTNKPQTVYGRMTGQKYSFRPLEVREVGMDVNPIPAILEAVGDPIAPAAVVQTVDEVSAVSSVQSPAKEPEGGGDSPPIVAGSGKQENPKGKK